MYYEAFWVCCSRDSSSFLVSALIGLGLQRTGFCSNLRYYLLGFCGVVWELCVRIGFWVLFLDFSAGGSSFFTIVGVEDHKTRLYP